VITASSITQKPNDPAFNAEHWTDLSTDHPTPPTSTAAAASATATAHVTDTLKYDWQTDPLFLYALMSGTTDLGGKQVPMKSAMVAWTEDYCSTKRVGHAIYKDRWRGEIDEKRIDTMDAVLIANGCRPAPSLRGLFNGDALVRSDFLINAIGKSPTQIIEQCEQTKNMLRFQDPRCEKPTTGEFKLDGMHLTRPVLEALLKALEECFEAGANVSIDEIVIAYTGKSGVTARIKFKREGDGFLIEAICCPNTGALLGFKCRADDTDEIEDPTGGDVSPTTKRCLAMLSKIGIAGAWRTVWCDNLFQSLKFCWYAWKQSKLKVCGVLRKNRGGAGECIIKEETKKEEILKAKTEEHRHPTTHAIVGRGRLRVKAFNINGAEITGGTFGVVCFGFYDDKPFNMLSTAHSSVVFMMKKRKVWDYEQKCYTEIEYFRLVIVDEYNHLMDGVDLQDQLRWYYRPDGKRMWRWKRWTWAVYSWVVNTRCVNGYILHKMLVKKALVAWDAYIVDEIARLESRSTTRSAPSLDEIKATAYRNAVNHFGTPKPQAFSHLDFRISIVRGLLCIRGGQKYGVRRVGRPSTSSSSSSSSSTSVMSSPTRAVQRTQLMSNAYFGTEAGSKKLLKKFPKFVLEKGQSGKGFGQFAYRLTNDELKEHRAQDRVDQKKVSGRKTVSNVCQVCNIMGPVFSLADKDEKKRKGKGYRGGSLRIRRARIICTHNECPTNYCSCACFNLWHTGKE